MESVEYQVKDNVAVIYLNRPEKFNSFNREMSLRLQKLLDESANNKKVRAIYLSGNGKAFSAGQDINELTGDESVSFNTILMEQYNPIVKKIRNIELPVICGVNGVAAGAGANIALCCDIVVAATSASFIQAFSKIGLIPDSAGTYFLPRLIGFQKASALMMLGEKVDAQEAERLGMIYKVLDDDGFQSSAFSLAVALAEMPTVSLAYIKKALNNTFSTDLYTQLKIENEYQFKAGETDDYREGIAAFTEKRKPVFKGK